MNEWIVALISAGSAILASALTAYISHRLEWRRRRIEENLRWLEERYRPALEFLGRLVGELAGQRPLNEGDLLSIRRRVEEIAREAWPCAIRLDPEDTGLRDVVLEALTYAHIAQSKDKLLEYEVRVLQSFRMLSMMFREEREGILSGKSLKELIHRRKRRKEEEARRFQRILSELQDFRDGRRTIDQMIRSLERSPLRGDLLCLILESLEREANEAGRERIQELRSACRKRGWISEGGPHGLYRTRG